eukprot:scaffold42779_cov191-Amphora_coffeaeformis.AAC.1
MTSHASAELEFPLPRPIALPRLMWSLQRPSQRQQYQGPGDQQGRQPQRHHAPRFARVPPKAVKAARKNGVAVVSEDDNNRMSTMGDSTDSGSEEESRDSPSRNSTSKE